MSGLGVHGFAAAACCGLQAWSLLGAPQLWVSPCRYCGNTNSCALGHVWRVHAASALCANADGCSSRLTALHAVSAAACGGTHALSTSACPSWCRSCAGDDQLRAVVDELRALPAAIAQQLQPLMDQLQEVTRALATASAAPSGGRSDQAQQGSPVGTGSPIVSGGSVPSRNGASGSHSGPMEQ